MEQIGKALVKNCDMNKFINLYEGLGIPLQPHKRTDNKKGCFIRLIGDSKYFDGYVNFYSEITFDENGGFLCQGFWE
jgi:hypothetical protein